LEPGGLNVERVRALHLGDACLHSASRFSADAVPIWLSVTPAFHLLRLSTRESDITTGPNLRVKVIDPNTSFVSGPISEGQVTRWSAPMASPLLVLV